MKVTDEIFSYFKESYKREDGFEESLVLAKALHQTAMDNDANTRVFFLALTYLMIGCLKSLKTQAKEAAVANFMMMLSAISPACCSKMSHQIANAIDIICSIFDYEDAVSATMSATSLLMAQNDDLDGLDDACEEIKSLAHDLHAELSKGEKQHHTH